MARLDIYRVALNAFEYVVDVQAELLSYLATRAVVPLGRTSAFPHLRSELNPVIPIAGEAFVLLPQAIATLPRNRLRRPVDNAVDHRDAITRALDILLIGF